MALGPTGHEACPPCALKIFHRGVAVDARADDGGLGSDLLIEFGEVAIASSPWTGKAASPRRPLCPSEIVNEKRAESLFLTLAMERNPIYVLLAEFLNTRWGEPGENQNSVARRSGAVG